MSQDKLLGGLLSAAFDESSCQSRYKSNLYRKPSPFPLSPYLAQKLRKYEAYHKKCGPGTKRYRRAVKQLKAGSGQGEREFQAEVEIISRVHHRHLVTLVGYCIAGSSQRLLVYEFVPNNTLEHHLHGQYAARCARS